MLFDIRSPGRGKVTIIGKGDVKNCPIQRPAFLLGSKLVVWFFPGWQPSMRAGEMTGITCPFKPLKGGLPLLFG